MNTKNNISNNNNNQKNNDWSKREIGALWKKDGPTQKYLSGYLTIDELGTQTKVNVVVFSNKNKSKDTAPDFRVYLSKDVNSKDVNSKNDTASDNSKTLKVENKSEKKAKDQVVAEEELL